MSGYAVTDPYTGERGFAAPDATDAELETALAAVDSARRGWAATTTVAERAATLARAAELHLERVEELADIVVREMGKPRAQAVGEIEFASAIIGFYAENAEKLLADQKIDSEEGDAIIRKAPLGPLLGIMPWNFPFYQVARFAGPNLVVGNPILLKHASQNPETALALEAIFRDAGFPEGAYVNIFATKDQLATAIADSRIRGVSLTGSEAAGAKVAEIAGRNLKKVVLELGGSDPFILLSTDDMDSVVESAVAARLDNNGQSCNAAKRFIVVDELFDEFAAKFVEKLGAVRPADPRAADTELGPLSSVGAAEAIEQQVDRAIANGARALLAPSPRDGAQYAPVVLTDVTRENPAYLEEFFGPVAMLFRVSGEDEAIEIANGTDFGLGSYVFTTDEAQAMRVADRIEAGMVYINVVLADSPELPFGGVKRSGTGRELGAIGIEEFINKKLIRRP